MLYSDPTSYISTIAERNNLKLISKMVDRTRIGIPNAITGKRERYRGTKIAFPNDWAESVYWRHAENGISDVFYAYGSITGERIEYIYGANSFHRQGQGTIAFDLRGVVLAHTWDCYIYNEYEIRAMLAPLAMVESYFRSRLAEDGSYEHSATVTIADEKPMLLCGIRSDRDNGWARKITLSGGVNPETCIRIKSRINVHYQLKYIIRIYHRSMNGYMCKSKLVFDVDDGTLLNASENFHMSNDAIIALIQPRA